MVPALRHPARAALVGALVVLGLVATGCGDSSSDTGTTTDSTVLGTPNKATGTPIKIGVVVDGKTDSFDNTNDLVAAKAAASYANDYLGGVNGHVIQVDECKTVLTPSGGTKCGLQMVKDKVAAVVVPTSGVDHSVFAALQGSGIPYLTTASADQAILGQPGAFVLHNPISGVSAGIKVAAEDGTKKAAMIVIDVPAATGPIRALATPFYAGAKIGLDLVPVSPQVADMTPQVQAAISKGAEQFSIIGTTAFQIAAVKSLKQLGFKGRVIVNLTGVEPSALASLPDGLKGVTNIANQTNDPDDADVKLFKAALAKYASVETGNGGDRGFIVMSALIRALSRVPGVDAKSASTTLSTMPNPLKLPFGSGETFQCGAKQVPVIPNACSAQALIATLDKAGIGHGYKPI